jgi:hypothetical protein
MVAVKVGLAGAAAVALVAAALAPPLAAQSFLDAYKAGVEAAEAGDWERVEGSMRTAIEGRATEERRLPLQLHFKPYVPHYWLGRALAEQGECPAALESFAESESQGVVQNLEEEHALLQAAKAACEEGLAAEAETRRQKREVAEAVAQAGDALAEARGLVPDAESDPDLAAAWERGEPSLAARLAEAEATWRRAEEIVAGAAPGDPELERATELARGTVTRLEAIRREAALRREALAEEKARAVERIEGLRRTGERLLSRGGGLATDVPAVRLRRAAVERALRESAAAGPDRLLQELRELGNGLERDIARLRATAEPPPEPLLAAADAWLRGEPEGVLAALEPGGGVGGGDGDGDPEAQGIGFDDPRARAHAHLLRAAARFALYHGGGGRDPGLLEGARQDLRECHQADPALLPVPRAFSPRFRAFFEEVTAGDSAAD